MNECRLRATLGGIKRALPHRPASPGDESGTGPEASGILQEISHAQIHRSDRGLEIDRRPEMVVIADGYLGVCRVGSDNASRGDHVGLRIVGLHPVGAGLGATYQQGYQDERR